MSRITAGIDIGTFQVKVVVAEHDNSNSAMPKILGIGYAESKGLRHGYIINQTDAVRSIQKAVRQAEKASRFHIERAYVSIGGIGLDSHTSVGSIMVTRADNEITELDIEKATKESQNNLPKNTIQNRKIIHSIPVQYKVDDKIILGKNPIGMKGVKLDIQMLYITCLTHHLEEIFQTIENANIEIADVMASPLASGLVTLSKTEKIAGCVLANIGSETVSIAVYEDDVPISLKIFQIGSNDITNDIALGFKVSLEDAERIKKSSSTREMGDEIPTRKLQEIINHKFNDIFELIDSHLKKIGKSGLLPAGIIITGGGSGIIDVEDLAKASLKLPSKIAHISKGQRLHKTPDTSDVKIKDAMWSVAYGLCVFGLHTDDTGSIKFSVNKRLFKTLFRKIINWIKKFLP